MIDDDVCRVTDELHFRLLARIYFENISRKRVMILYFEICNGICTTRVYRNTNNAKRSDRLIDTQKFKFKIISWYTATAQTIYKRFILRYFTMCCGRL